MEAPDHRLGLDLNMITTSHGERPYAAFIRYLTRK